MHPDLIKRERYLFHKYVMDYLQKSIRLADQKVSLILVIVGLAMPTLVRKWHDLLYLFQEAQVNWFLCLLLFFSTSCYIMSLGYAIAVFKPRLPSTLSTGYIFFLDIIGHDSVDEYVNKAKTISPEALLESVLRQNWVLSQIVTKKFKYTAYATNASIAWIVSLVICLLLIPSQN